MPLLIGLFSPVFTQRMGPFNSLLLAAAQPVCLLNQQNINAVTVLQ